MHSSTYPPFEKIYGGSLCTDATGRRAYIKDWVFEPQVQNDMLHHLKQSWDKLPLQGLEAIGAHYLSDAGLEELLMDLYACRGDQIWPVQEVLRAFGCGIIGTDHDGRALSSEHAKYGSSAPRTF